MAGKAVVGSSTTVVAVSLFYKSIQLHEGWLSCEYESFILLDAFLYTEGYPNLHLLTCMILSHGLFGSRS